MDLDLNDFAVFDSLLYRRYKRVKNWHSANKVSKEDLEPLLWFLLCISVFILLYFLFSYLQGFLPEWLEWIEAVGIIILFFAGMIAMGGCIGLVISSVRIVYHFVCYYIFKKTILRRILIRFEKKYILQEQLVTAKIKTALEENTSSAEIAYFLAEQQYLLEYIEMAQEKIGSAYPVLESDIEKAKESIAEKYKRSQTTTTSGTYRPSLKTTVTKKAPSKAKSVRQNSSNPDSVTPGQPISPSNSNPLSHTPVPATIAKEKANPNQPRLTNWEQVNASRLKIGKQGEEFVYQYEQEKLKRLELEHLVGEIEHSSKVIGDGLGYDIKSFNRRREQVYIEVKTTKGEFWSNLIFTRNELDFAKQNSQQFLLYRVYNFDEETGSGKLYIGSYEVIESYFSFEPQSFLAKQKA